MDQVHIDAHAAENRFDTVADAKVDVVETAGDRRAGQRAVDTKGDTRRQRSRRCPCHRGRTAITQRRQRVGVRGADERIGDVVEIFHDQRGDCDRGRMLVRLTAARHAQREAVGARRRRDAGQPRARIRREPGRHIRPDRHAWRQRAGRDAPRVGAVSAAGHQRRLDLTDAVRAEVGRLEQRRAHDDIDRDGGSDARVVRRVERRERQREHPTGADRQNRSRRRVIDERARDVRRRVQLRSIERRAERDRRRRRPGNNRRYFRDEEIC